MLIRITTSSFTLYTIIFQLGTSKITVPDCVQLGLQNDSPGQNETCFSPGYCEQYNYNQPTKARCRFYGQCCAPTPTTVNERLDFNSFHCHDGIYVVDECPSAYKDGELKTLCEKRITSTWEDLSANGWPVQSTTSGILYKNIYCAICNGLNIDSNDTRINGPKIDWPIAAIKSSLQNDRTDVQFEKLIESNDTQVYFLLEFTLDDCQDIVRKCPLGSDEKLVQLCDRGPALNVRDLGNRIYRNSICGACNDEFQLEASVDSTTNGNHPLALKWDHATSSLETLTENSIKPVLQTSNIAYVKLKDNNYQHDNPLKSKWFSEIDHYWCFDDYCQVQQRYYDWGSFDPQLTEYINYQQNSTFVWNLGNYECYSYFPDICNHFVVTSSELEKCQRPGCKGRSYPDLESKKCLMTDDLDSDRVIDDMEDTNEWEFKVLCDYLSSCGIPESKRNCYCDELCIYYGDCCHDAPDVADMKGKALKVSTNCHISGENMAWTSEKDGFNWGFEEVISCPNDYDDQLTIRRCESNTFSWKQLKSTPPVSDRETGVRYANIFCAKCNGVKEPVYWRQNFGCIQSNERCISLQDGADQMILQLRQNVSSETITTHTGKCDQTFLPPARIPVRRCRLFYNDEQFIKECPISQQYTALARKCDHEQTSFVWDSDYRYRNSYCALCHGLVRPGCYIIDTFDISASRNEGDGKKDHRTFIYDIDYQQRTCNFDSQFYLTFTLDTGIDSCLPLQNELRSCNCSSVFDFDSKTCIETGYQQNCSDYPDDEWRPSKYVSLSSDCLLYNFSYNPNKPENIDSRECSLCETCGTAVRLGTYSFDPPSVETSQNVYCATLAGFMARCKDALSIEHGYFSETVFCQPDRGDSGIPSYNRPNIAVAFNPIPRLRPVTIPTVHNQVCPNSTTEIMNPDSLLICPNSKIQLSSNSVTITEVIQSFHLTHTAVCYLKQGSSIPDYSITLLDIIHYTLIGLSLLAIIVYIVLYVKSRKHSTSVTFFVFLIATLFLALLAYCFNTLARENTIGCLVVVILMQFMFISVHTWTNAFAIWIYRGVTKVELVSQHSKKTVLKYSSYAWGVPLLIIAVSLIVHKSRTNFFDDVYDDKLCFFGSFQSRVVFFLVPVYALVIINSILCIIIMVTISRSVTITSNDRKRVRKNVFTCCKLFLVLGVHWVLLFLLFIPQSDESRRNMQTTLSIIIELQGIMVVLAYSISLKNVEKVSSYFKSSKFTLNTKSSSQSNKNSTAHSHSIPLQKSARDTR